MVACMVENYWKKTAVDNACKTLRAYILGEIPWSDYVVIDHKTFKKSGSNDALNYQDILKLLLQIQHKVNKHD